MYQYKAIDPGVTEVISSFSFEMTFERYSINTGNFIRHTVQLFINKNSSQVDHIVKAVFRDIGVVKTPFWRLMQASQ